MANETYTLSAALTFEVKNYIEANRKEYFEDHTLDWCVEEMITRAKAEITRSIKSTQKRKDNDTAGALLKAFNLTPEQAKQVILEAQKQKKIAATA